MPDTPDRYDVVVIGAGPGGYVAAIRCAQLGLKVACVDRWLDPAGKPALGGTCLNVGCIPSKALLDSSQRFAELGGALAAHGIQVGAVEVDVAAMIRRKDKIVRQLTRGIGALLRKNGVTFHAASARLLPGRRVALEATAGEVPEVLEAGHLIIATGSYPIELPSVPFDGERILDSSGALALTEVPDRLAVIGAGVIGLELGSVWRRLGAEVILLEALDTFLPAADAEIAAEARRLLTRQGLDIRLGARVEGAERRGEQVAVRYADGDGEHTLEVDRVVVAVGRRPCTEGLGAAEVGLELDEGGRIPVDGEGRTALDGVWAIGDVVPGPMLAHKASEEGVAVAERIAGQAGQVDHDLIPWVIYTHPEIAWVGKSEQQLEAEGVAYRAGTFPFAASGRALAAGESAGRVKVLGAADDDRLLGVHIIGPQASELIAEAATAMAFGAATEDLARICHAHPTLAETLHEAALAADGRAIHI